MRLEEKDDISLREGDLLIDDDAFDEREVCICVPIHLRCCMLVILLHFVPIEMHCISEQFTCTRL